MRLPDGPTAAGGSRGVAGESHGGAWWPWLGLATATLALIALVGWLVMLALPQVLIPDDGRLVQADLVRARNELRGTLVQAVGGLVLVGGLVVTFQTYRSGRAEHRERTLLTHSEQVTDLYTRAVEQLGSSHPAVRLGGAHSLERLAETEGDQRARVVEVLCAYLRMPFELPAEPDEVEGRRISASDTETAQELQVRRAIQDLLVRHARSSIEEDFWGVFGIDLSGAVLVDLDAAGCQWKNARFVGTTFLGSTTNFHRARFEGTSSFAGALFDPRPIVYTGRKMWYEVAAVFDEVVFNGHVSFYEATFKGTAGFNDAVFHNGADFGGAHFPSKPRSLGREPRLGVQLYRASVVTSESPRGRGVVQWPDGWLAEADSEQPGAAILREI